MNDSFPNSVSIHVPNKEPLVSKERSLLTTRQVNRIRAVLMLGGLDYADLEDGLQQLRMKLLETQASARPPIENLEAWVSVVASRVAIDWHRIAVAPQKLVQGRPDVQARHGSGPAVGCSSSVHRSACDHVRGDHITSIAPCGPGRPGGGHRGVRPITPHALLAYEPLVPAQPTSPPR